MATVPKPPQGATAPPVPRVDLAEPTIRAAWLVGMCEHAADLIAAALDATAPPALRMLGRKAAREHVTEAADALAVSFAAAGLDLSAPPSAFRIHLERGAEPRK